LAEEQILKFSILKQILKYI